MGLLTGLLTLPLAPVRATAWIAERLAEEAARELDDEASIRRRLAELEMHHDLGEMSDEDYLEAEETLVARLAEIQSSAPLGDDVPNRRRLA